MFDPYHKWLGIAPKDQPPNHYRLLAVDVFESDPEVIDAAANRQMAYLQQRATGEHAVLSQQLLNEIAAARLCLLNPQKKADYDIQLKRTLSGDRHEGEKPTSSAADSWLTDILDDPPATVSPIPVSPTRPGWTRRLQIWHLAVLVGVLGLLSVGILAFVTSGSTPNQQASYVIPEPTTGQEESVVTTLAADRSKAVEEVAEAATTQPIPDTTSGTAGGESSSTLGSSPLADSSSPGCPAPVTPPETKNSPQRSDLFDGRTLDGWQGIYNRDYWSVVGDALVGNGRGISHLHRPENFDDFELHAEAKINSSGRAGVLFRAAEWPEKGKWEPDGYKVWIVGSGVGVRERTGSLAGLAEFTRNIVADDQWFSLDIVAKGNRITVKVDGQTVVDFVDAQARYRSGKIAVQVWGTKNGTGVAFKNLRVKPLGAYSDPPQ